MKITKIINNKINITICFDDGVKIEHSHLHQWYRISNPPLYYGIILESEILNNEILKGCNKDTIRKYEKHINQYGRHYKMALNQVNKLKVLL